MRGLSKELQAGVRRAAQQIADDALAAARQPAKVRGELAPSGLVSALRARLGGATASRRTSRPVLDALAARRPQPRGAQAVELLLEAQTMTCVVDSREAGADELALAAFFVDVEDAVIAESAAVELGEFRKADVKPLALGALSHTVRQNQVFPRSYLAVLCLAERDRGGFEDFVAEVAAALVAELDLPDPVGKGQKVFNRGLIVALVLAGAGVATIPLEPVSVALMVASAISLAITAIAAGIVGDEVFPVETELLLIEAFGQPLAQGLTQSFNLRFERSHAVYALAGQFRVVP